MSDWSESNSSDDNGFVEVNIAKNSEASNPKKAKVNIIAQYTKGMINSRIFTLNNQSHGKNNQTTYYICNKHNVH